VSLDGTRRIDLTRPRETVLGVDASLGLVLRCPTCEPAMSGDQVRWRTIEAPIVDQVLPGSVADEAGLRAGDAIVEVAGTDIRRETGLRRLLDYPLRDFAITWQRGSDIHRGTMNLRIVSRRVTRVAPEVVVAARDEPRGFGATLGKWWRALTGR
jgi:membrane-associated protease RseP (regulator of RpoE activity)